MVRRNPNLCFYLPSSFSSNSIPKMSFLMNFENMGEEIGDSGWGRRRGLSKSKNVGHSH